MLFSLRKHSAKAVNSGFSLTEACLFYMCESESGLGISS